MKLTDQQILDIVDYLDSGLRCFYNKKTGELKTIFNSDTYFGADEKLLEEEREEIEENWEDYFEFEGMSSRESFEIMVDFTETIDNEELQCKLVNSLRKSKPFKNFKWEVDNSGEYRQKWFDYQRIRYIDWIKEQIGNYKRSQNTD
jgi:hypothetical protein